MEGKDGKEGKKRKLEDSDTETTETPEISEEVAAKLLAPLTREQFADILKRAIPKHSDMLDEVRKIIDKDITLRKLFVRGLGFETTTETFKSVFAKHGELEDVHVVLDKNTRKNKGYAFVTYKHVDGALSALEEPSKYIDGRMSISNLASAGPQQQLQQQQQNQLLQLQQQQQLQQQILQPGVPLQPIQPVLPLQPVIADVSLRRIYVGNVPTDMQPATLTNFFAQYGDIEEGPLGYDKQTGKSRGFSLIVYKTIEGTQRALEDPVKSIDGHQLFCKLAAEGQKQKGLTNQGQAVPDSIDKGLGYGLLNPTLSALSAHQNAINTTSLALSSLSRDPVAASLPYNSLNSSLPLGMGHLQGNASGRTSLGAGSYGINPYGSAGYGSRPYSSLGGAALYGIPSSSSVGQTAAYDGASHYPLGSLQSQHPGASPSSGVLPGMRSYYTS